MTNSEFKTLGNLYELFGIHPSAPDVLIKILVPVAFKAWIKKYHHDLNTKNIALEQRLVKGKEVLLSPKLRAAYDKFCLAAGGNIIGDYEILSEIGEGAFGATYKAKHRLTGELVCLKQNLYPDPEDIQFLEEEALLLSRLQHHSIPGYRNFFNTSEGSRILAMSFVDGVSIDQVIEKQDRISFEHVCWITQRLLNVLNYLEHHGVVHSDVKPNNIILPASRKGGKLVANHNAVLVDFGFACLRPKKDSKPKGGTEIFAAPELLVTDKTAPPTPATDLYSLAKTMIYAMGGDPRDKIVEPGGKVIKGPIYPNDTPPILIQFFNAFLHSNPLHRLTWQKADLVKELSKVRQALFGSKISGKDLVLG